MKGEEKQVESGKQFSGMVEWIDSQIDHTASVIRESKENKNPGRQALYEGMRDAFIRCKNRLNVSP